MYHRGSTAFYTSLLRLDSREAVINTRCPTVVRAAETRRWASIQKPNDRPYDRHVSH